MKYDWKSIIKEWITSGDKKLEVFCKEQSISLKTAANYLSEEQKTTAPPSLEEVDLSFEITRAQRTGLDNARLIEERTMADISKGEMKLKDASAILNQLSGCRKNIFNYTGMIPENNATTSWTEMKIEGIDANSI
ncbi:MAG: hypothetical protein K8S56_08575 [Candidatus Cloacimonetes bacterium]|nr:hypothetical protein [Candidatus Cloacimonadota bacterium]